MYINDILLLEKRISQISSSIEVIFSFDIIKTKHAEERSDFSKRGLDSDNKTHISNSEMSEFISLYKRIIAENICNGNIENGTEFVIRSLKWSLSMAIVAEMVTKTYWKLIIKTVFRESDEYQLKVANNQLVLEI